MKQCMEKRISLHALRDPDAVVHALEAEAEIAARDGWFFVTSTTDEWLDTVTLHFEKDLDV